LDAVLNKGYGAAIIIVHRAVRCRPVLVLARVVQLVRVGVLVGVRDAVAVAVGRQRVQRLVLVLERVPERVVVGVRVERVGVDAVLPERTQAVVVEVLGTVQNPVRVFVGVRPGRVTVGVERIRLGDVPFVRVRQAVAVQQERVGSGLGVGRDRVASLAGTPVIIVVSVAGRTLAAPVAVPVTFMIGSLLNPASVDGRRGSAGPVRHRHTLPAV